MTDPIKKIGLAHENLDQKAYLIIKEMIAVWRRVKK